MNRIGPRTVPGDEKRSSGTPVGRAASRKVASSSFVFTTQSLPAAQQAEAWRAGNAPSLDVVFNDNRAGGSGFAAEREVVSFGPFVMTRVMAESATAIRRRGHARHDGLDHWSLNLTTRGDRRFRWDRGDRCMSVPAGQLHVQSLDEAYWGFREDTEWIGVFFARDSLPWLSVHLDATRDHPRTDALSGMLAEYLARLWTFLPTMTPEERSGMAEATTAMIRACLRPTPDALAEAAPHLQAHQRARALSFIRRHLGSSRLTPQVVARAIGISRTQLYRAFETVGGVIGVIQDERLKVVQRMLSVTTQTRRIHDIAESAGFFDASTFSRLFRQNCGMTASEWRDRAKRDARMPILDGVPGFSLADFLRIP